MVHSRFIRCVWFIWCIVKCVGGLRVGGLRLGHMIDSGLVGSTSLRGVPREQKMLSGRGTTRVEDADLVYMVCMVSRVYSVYGVYRVWLVSRVGIAPRRLRRARRASLYGLRGL